MLMLQRHLKHLSLVICLAKEVCAHYKQPSFVFFNPLRAVYFADISSKSANYCHATPANPEVP